MNDTPLWYTAGLRFECQQCGGCCTGEPGYVWVSDEEIRMLAKALGYSLLEFESRFVRQVGKRRSLLELANGDCVLFDNTKRCCRVYDERPRQCRTWPFWDSNLESLDVWQETANFCPGCNLGDIIPLEEILKRRGVMDL